MLTYEEVMEMQNRDIRSINPDDLVDIRDVKIDPKLPQDEKLKSYIEQIKYPNLFRCGKIVVKVSYTDTDRTLNDAVRSYLERCSRL